MSNQSSMVRKLLTKPIWWWERNRSYAVRARHDRLPPIAVHKGPSHYVVLTTPASLNDALWTAWSWYRFLRPNGFEVQLAVDGELDPSASAAVQRLFPGISVYELRHLLQPMCERWPAIGAFVEQYPLGRKLGLMLAVSQMQSFLFSDHDVLAFNDPVELLAFAEKDLPCYMLEEVEGNVDTAILRECDSLGLDYFSRFNSGLLYVPRNSLSLQTAANLLASWRPPATSWFTEQTVLNVLMRAAQAQALPAERYVISGRRQFYWQKDVDYKSIVARHFTGTVRHVMYGRGIPAILCRRASVANLCNQSYGTTKV